MGGSGLRVNLLPMSRPVNNWASAASRASLLKKLKKCFTGSLIRIKGGLSDEALYDYHFDVCILDK